MFAKKGAPWLLPGESPGNNWKGAGSGSLPVRFALGRSRVGLVRILATKVLQVLREDAARSQFDLP